MIFFRRCKAISESIYGKKYRCVLKRNHEGEHLNREPEYPNDGYQNYNAREFWYWKSFSDEERKIKEVDAKLQGYEYSDSRRVGPYNYSGGGTVI